MGNTREIAGKSERTIKDTEEYFNECENFPQSKFKDMVDASSSAFTELESGATYSAPPKDSQLGKSSYWNK